MDSTEQTNGAATSRPEAGLDAIKAAEAGLNSEEEGVDKKASGKINICNISL